MSSSDEEIQGLNPNIEDNEEEAVQLTKRPCKQTNRQRKQSKTSDNQKEEDTKFEPKIRKVKVKNEVGDKEECKKENEPEEDSYDFDESEDDYEESESDEKEAKRRRKKELNKYIESSAEEDPEEEELGSDKNKQNLQDL